MFTKLGPNEVQSKDGFSVKRTHRYEVIYCEDGKTLKIEVEPGDGLAIYKESMEWLPPNQHDFLSDKDKKRILTNISKAFDFLEIDHIII